MNAMDTEESSNTIFSTPPDIREIESINQKLLPPKSQQIYEAAYITYKKWKESNKINLTSENVLKAYFKQLSEKYKPSTLWSAWSMLRSIINLREGIDIREYKQLKAFLKKESDGYTTKKSKVLSSEEVQKFINEACDNKYLATKVALIFGVCGACRREELVNIKMTDVQHQGDIILIKILDTKTKIPRSFIIEDEFCTIVKNYQSLRPPNAFSDRFFLNYQNGKCSNQVIGKNKFGAMPKQIAEFLNLPDPNLYTGQSFRRTSATLLANSGADLMTLKRHGGCKSTTVAKRYIKDSITSKRRIGQMITSSVSVDLSTSKEIKEPQEPRIKKIENLNVIATTSENIESVSESNTVIDKLMEKTSSKIQKIDRKVCRLCAKLKPVDFLFPFHGTDYEQIIHNFLPFGLCIKKDDGLPTEICQTCSRKLWNCKHTVESFIEANKKLKLLLPTDKDVGADNETLKLTRDKKSEDVESDEVLLLEIKQETPENGADELQAEMEVENEAQAVSENSLDTEIEIKDEMATIFTTKTDSLNGIINAGFKKVMEFNGNEHFVVKDEPKEIQSTEREENALIDDLSIKEEVEDFDNLEIHENNSTSVNRNPQSAISSAELFECCDCKKRYINKETVITHITNVHAKGQITYHAKFEAIRVNIKNNSMKGRHIPSEASSRRQIYHHVVRPTLNKTDNKLFTCNICGLTVKRNNILKEHMMRHRRNINDQAAGIYRCNICKRTMRSQHLLNCHDDLHRGVKTPFACEKCEQKFSEYRKWYVHQRKHTGDRPFACKICDKTFRTKQTMKYHITRVHMREKQYECLSCRKQFKYMSALTYHVKNLECKTLHTR